MSEDNSEMMFNLGELSGEVKAAARRMDVLEERQIQFEALVNSKLDKLSESMVALTSSMSTLTQRTSKWGIPAFVIFGSGGAMVVFLTWLENKFPGIAQFLK